MYPSAFFIVPPFSFELINQLAYEIPNSDAKKVSCTRTDELIFNPHQFWIKCY
jgi:hypothetical protein